MSQSARANARNPLSATDFHVLMVLSEGPSYGYSIMKAVKEHSEGTVAPDIGSLYRVLARLMTQGWVSEAEPPAEAPASSRGRTRRYYDLTGEGRSIALAEAARLARLVDLARDHDLLSPGGAS